ncbi:MAG: hypothetical protein IT162_01310 [Bryobacterales bacterium]|nr:hypothetical protein [Bryobacterales bacterium]
MYGSVPQLEMVSYTAWRGTLFFRDGRLALAVLTLQPEGEFPVESAAWLQALGQPAAKWPSVVGKNHRVWVYPERGGTAAVAGGRVKLAELFPPMALAEYERLLY